MRKLDAVGLPPASRVVTRSTKAPESGAMGPKCTPEIVISSVGLENPTVVPPSPLLLLPVGKQPTAKKAAIQSGTHLVRTNVAPASVSRPESSRLMDRSLTP